MYMGILALFPGLPRSIYVTRVNYCRDRTLVNQGRLACDDNHVSNGNNATINDAVIVIRYTAKLQGKSMVEYIHVGVDNTAVYKCLQSLQSLALHYSIHHFCLTYYASNTQSGGTWSTSCIGQAVVHMPLHTLCYTMYMYIQRLTDTCFRGPSACSS